MATETPVKARYEQSREEYAGAKPVRQPGQSAQNFRSEQRVYEARVARHKQAVADAIADGTLTEANWGEQRAKDYGAWGSSKWGNQFQEAARKGEAETEGGTPQFPVTRTKSGLLHLEGRPGLLVDTKANRTKLHTEAVEATKALEFDQLIWNRSFGGGDAWEAAESRFGGLRSQSGERMPQTAALNDRLMNNLASGELKKRRSEAAKAVGATAAQLKDVADNTPAGRKARAELVDQVKAPDWRWREQRGPELPPSRIETPQQLRDAMLEHGVVGADGKTPMTPREARLLAGVYDRLAKFLDMPLGQFVAEIGNRARYQEGVGNVKGQLLPFNADLNGYVLKLVFGKADASTLFHEPAHIVLKELAARGHPFFEVAVAEYERATGKRVEWTGNDTRPEVHFQEWWSDRFEQWLHEGQPGNTRLSRVFGLVRDWMRAIYGAITGTRLDKELSPEIREVFESLLSKRGESGQRANSERTKLPGDTSVTAQSGWPGSRSENVLPPSEDLRSMLTTLPLPTETGKAETMTAPPGSANAPSAHKGGSAEVGASMPGSVASPASKVQSPKSAGKEPWQMTLAEALGKPEGEVDEFQNRDRLSPKGEAHRAAIERAVSEGKPIPERVLKDYPWLAAEVKIKPYVESLRGMTDEQLRAEEKATRYHLNKWAGATPAILPDGTINPSLHGPEGFDASAKFNAVNREIDRRAAGGGEVEQGRREGAKAELPDNLTDAEKNRVRSLEFHIAGTDKTVASIEAQMTRDRENLERHKPHLTREQIADEERRIAGFGREVEDLRRQQAEQRAERDALLAKSKERPGQRPLFDEERDTDSDGGLYQPDDAAGARPPIKWMGGKRFLVPKLKELFERSGAKRLVEPFFGGGSVSLGIRPESAQVNDAQPFVINLYREIAGGLKYDLPYRQTPEDFLKARNRFNELVRQGVTTGPEVAQLYYYINKTGFNGIMRFNQQGECNTPFGRTEEQVREARKNKLPPTTDFTPWREAFQSIRFQQGDFEKVKLRPGDFVYADPPYDQTEVKYHAGGFTWDDQVRLANWLAKHDGPVVVSNSDTPRIVKLYKSLGFDVEFVERSGAISSDPTKRQPVREMLATRGLRPGQEGLFQREEPEATRERIRKEDEAFGKAVDKYIRTGQGGDMPMRVGQTSSVLQKLGARELPMVMDARVLDKVISEHKLPVEMIKGLPKELREPVMVFDSATRPKAFVVLTAYEERGAPVVAAVHLEEREGRHVVNKVESLYGKDSLDSVQRWLDAGLLRYHDTQRSLDWLQSRGLQLPKEGTGQGFTKPILTQHDVVKEFGGLFQREEPRRTAAESASAKATADKGGEARRALLELIGGTFNQNRKVRRGDGYAMDVEPGIATDPTPEDAARVQAVIEKLPKPEQVLYTETARQARREAARLATLPVEEQTKVLDAWVHGRDAVARDAEGNRQEFLFQREETERTEPRRHGDTEYRVEERNGRLHVVNTATGKVDRPGNSLYSGTLNERERLQAWADELNKLEEDRTAPGSLRAVDRELEKESSVFRPESRAGGGGTMPPDRGGAGGEGSGRAGGSSVPLSDEPTQTPSRWRWILGNSGVDLLVKAGGAMKQLGETVKRYYDRQAELKGQLGKPLRDILGPLSRTEKRQVLDEFAAYMKARESEAPDAERLLSDAGETTRRLVNAWNDLTEFTSAENQRLGFRVFDRRLHNGKGGWREIGSFGRSYWPRSEREDIADIMRQGKGEKFEALVKEAAQHWNVTEERARIRLAEAQKSALQTADDYFANVERAREADLPAPWYEYRPEVVFDRFIDRWSKRFAQVEAFGQVTEGAYAGEKSWSGQLFKDVYLNTLTDKNAGMVIRAIHDDVYGVRDARAWDSVVNAARTYTALSKYVTNPWSTIRNLTQPFVTTLPEFGPRAFAKGMWDAIVHAKENWKLAKDAGVIQDDLLAGFVVADDLAAKQQKLIGNAAKWTGSLWAEQWNRGMTAAAARAWARDALAELQADPNTRTSRLAKAEFRRLEVDWEQLARQMHTGDSHGAEWRKLERAAATGTQFGYDMRQSPIWSGSPGVKLLFQFQKFGLQMHRRMWQEVVLPATKGEMVDGVTLRNYGKALLTLGAMVGVGEVMLTVVRALLFDKRRKDADWDEIARTLDKNTWRGRYTARTSHDKRYQHTVMK